MNKNPDAWTWWAAWIITVAMAFEVGTEFGHARRLREGKKNDPHR